MITGFYASLLGFLFVYLSLRVIRSRREKRIALMFQHDEDLAYAIRAHGNMVEYSTFFLILLLIGELSIESNLSISVMFLHGIGMMFLIGRLLHAYGFVTQRDGRYRISGMQLSIWAIIAIAIFDLVTAILY